MSARRFASMDMMAGLHCTFTRDVLLWCSDDQQMTAMICVYFILIELEGLRRTLGMFDRRTNSRS